VPYVELIDEKIGVTKSRVAAPFNRFLSDTNYNIFDADMIGSFLFESFLKHKCLAK
jgi:hypothetical protein